MIDLSVQQEQTRANAEYCRQRGILLPTFEQMKHPETIPESIRNELKDIGLWDMHPRNIFRITWKNEPKEHGGGFNGVNALVLPSELTGCKAKILGLVGKWFPTGAHKVGATYGCLAPRLITGQFDPKRHRAVWPSTGNYCRGGAYVSSLLGCESIAILPEEMSQERFEWLKEVAGEVIATPGCESNVKEIFDTCWDLRKSRDDVMIFNQFEEFGNVLWHYHVTGSALEEAVKQELGQSERVVAGVFSSGSAGTLGAGYAMKHRFKDFRLAAAEALQCPTMLMNGFGGHRIEGIGDKHIPWIHDLKSTDLVVAVDDEISIRLLRLFNEPKGQELLKEQGVPDELINKLHLLGISGLGNMVAAIKLAKYFELTSEDCIVTVFTDSMELYGSRIRDLRQERGEYSAEDAWRDMEAMSSVDIGSMEELTYYGKKRIHNLKYYTWIEQQGRELEELNRQWFDHEGYWGSIFSMAPKVDALVKEFNEMIAG